MFTGIIEDLGKVKTVSSKSGFLTIQTSLDGIHIGDSVSINGICLTATKIDRKNGSIFNVNFNVSAETVKCTNFGTLKKNAYVNLERSLKVGDRISGHFITGHVEHTGKILKIQPKSNSHEFVFSVPGLLMKYIVPKGSIGIDGVSLTINSTRNSTFSVSVIPHTFKNTTLGYKKVGHSVNLEPDIFVKSVENVLNYQSNNRNLSSDFLIKHGF